MLDAGLEGRRRMNAVDEHVVPPARRTAGQGQVTPDPLSQNTVSASTGASPGIGKEGSSARSIPMVMGKGRVWKWQAGEAAYAYNDAIARRARGRAEGRSYC